MEFTEPTILSQVYDVGVLAESPLWIEYPTSVDWADTTVKWGRAMSQHVQHLPVEVRLNQCMALSGNHNIHSAHTSPPFKDSPLLQLTESRMV